MHQWFLENAKTYFKRELYPDLKALGLHPYPEPTFRETLHVQPEKTIDVFCSFPQKHTGLRSEAIRVCERLQAEGKYNIVINDRCTPEEYIHNVKSAYVTLDAHGAGQINHRFLEIIALRSVVCRQKYTVEFYQDYDASMVIEYESGDELYYKLDILLNMKPLLLAMEKWAHSHYLNYHTIEKVGNYIKNNIID